MGALISPDTNSKSVRPVVRWWTRLEQRWNEIQVGRQGSYSVERLESFAHYCKTVSPTRVMLVCILTPLPALLTAILLESLPLQSPFESWTANWMYWIRLGLANFAMCFAGSCQLAMLVPELDATFPKELTVTLGVVGVYLATFLLGAHMIGFPIPLSWYVGGFLAALYIPIMLLIVFGRIYLLRAACRPNLMRLFHYFQAFMTLVNIFPLYKVLYGLAPDPCRGLIIFVLPVWRLAAKRFMVSSLREMEDFIPCTVAMTVDYFSTLFISVCMSRAGAIYVSVLLIMADMGQLVLEFREVRSNGSIVFKLLQEFTRKAQTYGYPTGNTKTQNLPAFILTVTRNPNAFHIASMEGIRVNACYPHSIAEENRASFRVLMAINNDSAASAPMRSKQISRSLQWPHTRLKTTIVPAPRGATIQLADPSAEGKNAVCPNSDAIVTNTAESGEISKRLVLQGLQLLFHCEYLILVEYVECIVPLIYVVYKSVLEQLPNVVYYPGGAGQFGIATVVIILVFAALEIVSLLLLHTFLRRKFAFSPLYQLAFVLETQFPMVQAQLFIQSILLLQYELQHYGTDFTFQFKWLHKSK